MIFTCIPTPHPPKNIFRPKFFPRMLFLWRIAHLKLTGGPSSLFEGLIIFVKGAGAQHYIETNE